MFIKPGKFFLVLFALLLVSQWGPLFGQDKSNRGKEFWLGYGHNGLFIWGDPPNNQTQVLYLSTDAQPAKVTVSVNGTGWSKTVNIPAYTVDYSVVIPKSGQDDARLQREGLSVKGIHILSDVPIVAYAHQYGAQSSGATMLMPVETLGYTYYSLNYTQVSNMPDCYSWFYMVAAENNTRLLITPSDSTEGGWLPGQTYTVNLSRGEIYNVFGRKTGTYTGKDLTGSKIVSVAGSDGTCHPVAVFSGSSRNVLCGTGQGGEVMQQQVFPVSAWGTRYLTHHTVHSVADLRNPFLNTYRVAVRNPSTVVKRNGVVMRGLTNNFYYEFTSTGGDLIEADGPVLVAQFPGSSNGCTGESPRPLGDPEMIYLSSVEQGQKSVLFYTSRNAFIDFVYTNVYLPTAAVPSLRVDGAALPSANVIPHPADPSYSVALVRFMGPAAQHSITCDSTFNAIVYGLGTYESYAYNAGTLINNLDTRSSIKNTLSTLPVDSFTCPNTPFRLQVQLAYRATSLNWQLSQVAGLQPAVDSLIVDPVPVDSSWVNGRKYYRYTLQQDFTLTTPGTYNIPFQYTHPDIDACNQTESGAVTVVVKPGPSADFTNFSGHCASDSISFGRVATSDAYTLSQYLWTFSDGATYPTQTVTRKFPGAGPQQVRLQLLATNGCTGDTSRTVVIDAVPVARFGVSGRNCPKEPLLFSDSSVIGAGSITAWKWLMGDGTVLAKTAGTPFSHAYDTAGSYPVQLVASSDKGCNSDTARLTVAVLNASAAALFTITADTLCIGKPIGLRADTAGITGWQWSLGDGAMASTPALTHHYGTAGTYTIGLVVKDLRGCPSAPFSRLLTIARNPVVDAGPDKYIKPGESVTLEARMTSPDRYRYVWAPPVALNSTTVLNPVAAPPTTTQYLLTATDTSSLCAASDSMTVLVFNDLHIPTAFTPNGDGKNDAWNIPALAAYPEAQVTVYNRWGEIVYRGKGYMSHPWDGRVNGKRTGTTTYVYLIQLNDPAGQQFKGTITVIR